MTERDFAAENRAIKVERIVSHALTVHSTLKAHGALGEFSTPGQWILHPAFPFDALVAASGSKPASEVTKAAVLSALGEGAG